MPKKYVIIPVNTSIDDYYSDIQRQADARSHNYRPRFTEMPSSQAELSKYNLYASQSGGDFADAKTVTVSNNVDQSTYGDQRQEQQLPPGEERGLSTCAVIAIAVVIIAVCCLLYILFLA